MSNYEDAIGRAQAMIDAGYNSALTGSPKNPRVEALVSLARVQLELASMYESQPEVEVEGTDVSAELLVAALADGSLKQKLVEQFEAKAAPDKMRPFTLAGIAEEVVRGVLMGKAGSEADAGFTDADLEGVPEMAERAASEGDWMERDMPQPFKPDWKQPTPCGVLDDEGTDCSFPKGHPSSHSWEWGVR